MRTEVQAVALAALEAREGCTWHAYLFILENELVWYLNSIALRHACQRSVL